MIRAHHHGVNTPACYADHDAAVDERYRTDYNNEARRMRGPSVAPTGRTIINELGRSVFVDVHLSQGRMVSLEMVGPDSESTWEITIDEAYEVWRQLGAALRNPLETRAQESLIALGRAFDQTPSIYESAQHYRKHIYEIAGVEP